MSQKQLSGILGIGTSFISQIETGKDPMPSYIPDKLAEAFGRDEVDRFQRESFDAKQILQKKYLFPASGSVYASKKFLADDDEGLGTDLMASVPSYKRLDTEGLDRVLDALARRDELALRQQIEYEKQGARIDELITMLKSQS